jgi:hypothetical protein
MEKYYFFIEPVKILANKKMLNHFATLNKWITTCKKHANNRVTMTYKYATDFKKSANRKPVPGWGGREENAPHVVLEKQPTCPPCGLENILTKD